MVLPSSIFSSCWTCDTLSFISFTSIISIFSYYLLQIKTITECSIHISTCSTSMVNRFSLHGIYFNSTTFSVHLRILLLSNILLQSPRFIDFYLFCILCTNVWYYIDLFENYLLYEKEEGCIDFTESSAIKSTRFYCSLSYFDFNWNTFSSFFSFYFTMDELFRNWLSISIYLSFSVVNLRFFSINSTDNIGRFNTTFTNIIDLRMIVIHGYLHGESAI